jgi:hypothetical protein
MELAIDELQAIDRIGRIVTDGLELHTSMWDW